MLRHYATRSADRCRANFWVRQLLKILCELFIPAFRLPARAFKLNESCHMAKRKSEYGKALWIRYVGTGCQLEIVRPNHGIPRELLSDTIHAGNLLIISILGAVSSMSSKVASHDTLTSNLVKYSGSKLTMKTFRFRWSWMTSRFFCSNNGEAVCTPVSCAPVTPPHQ